MDTKMVCILPLFYSKFVDAIGDDLVLMCVS